MHQPADEAAPQGEQPVVEPRLGSMGPAEDMYIEGLEGERLDMPQHSDGSISFWVKRFSLIIDKTFYGTAEDLRAGSTYVCWLWDNAEDFHGNPVKFKVAYKHTTLGMLGITEALHDNLTDSIWGIAMKTGLIPDEQDRLQFDLSPRQEQEWGSWRQFLDNGSSGNVLLFRARDEFISKGQLYQKWGLSGQSLSVAHPHLSTQFHYDEERLQTLSTGRRTTSSPSDSMDFDTMRDQTAAVTAGSTHSPRARRGQTAASSDTTIEMNG